MGGSIILKIQKHTSPLWVIFEIAFFRSLAAALLNAILPLYFRSFVDSDAAVGIIFVIGYASSCISNVYASRIIAHIKQRKSLLLALAVFTSVFLGFSIAKHSAIIFLLFAIYQFILALFVTDVSLYIKHYSDYKTIAENAGKLGSFANIGWFVGPFLGSLIADKYGFESVFILSAIIALIALFTFFFVRIGDEEVNVQHSRSFAGNLKYFFKDPNLRRTYINNAGLGFIFSIWDFLPLLMAKIGATVPIIGMTKSLMGVPQSIFEYPVGRLADKETGEKKLFIVGYIMAALFTLFLGFTTDLRVFITFFFIAATGTSLLEMTRDSYFFRQIKEKEVELISVYRTSDTLPYLVGQCLAILTLSLIPIEWWFIAGGSIAFIVFVSNAFRLKELKKHAS